jgi:hypothetical protein
VRMANGPFVASFLALSGFSVLLFRSLLIVLATP